LLGDDFQGVLGSDFYAAYNIHHGLHQHPLKVVTQQGS